MGGAEGMGLGLLACNMGVTEGMGLGLLACNTWV